MRLPASYLVNLSHGAAYGDALQKTRSARDASALVENLEAIYGNERAIRARWL